MVILIFTISYTLITLTVATQLLNLTTTPEPFLLCDDQGRRSHRIIGGHKRKLGVWRTKSTQRGPGTEPR